MRKATAIYHAPEGDNEVVHMGGVRFIDGETVDLNSDDHPHLISKLENHPHFEFEIGEDDGQTKKKRGRPSNAEKEAKAAEAKDPSQGEQT
jgi:hypothetical protein